jgi:ABC-type Fe3+-hydroxamate transport system substrate-binding protein
VSTRGAIRVVSLVPSVTETLTSWDVTPIACTRFCERDDLAHVGGTKDPDLAAIVALEPDVVVLDVEENRREDHDQLVASGVEVHVLCVRSLADVATELAALAARVGVRFVPPTLREPTAIRARAFIPIWRRPWMALGAPTYGTSVLAHLGVANVFADEGPYPSTDLEAAARRGPDAVLAPSEPYPFTVRQLGELETVAPTTFVDGKDLFWWGTRTPFALGRLDAALRTLGS